MVQIININHKRKIKRDKTKTHRTREMEGGEEEEEIPSGHRSSSRKTTMTAGFGNKQKPEHDGHQRPHHTPTIRRDCKWAGGLHLSLFLLPRPWKTMATFGWWWVVLAS
jgi:hypothetical protein